MKIDFKTIQEILGVNKIIKSEFNSLYRIGKVIKGRCRPIIINFNDFQSKAETFKTKKSQIY